MGSPERWREFEVSKNSTVLSKINLTTLKSTGASKIKLTNQTSKGDLQESGERERDRERVRERQRESVVVMKTGEEVKSDVELAGDGRRCRRRC